MFNSSISYHLSLECNVSPDFVVQRLPWPDVIPQWSLLHDLVPLPQLVEHVQLLLADVQGLFITTQVVVSQHPGRWCCPRR